MYVHKDMKLAELANCMRFTGYEPTDTHVEVMRNLLVTKHNAEETDELSRLVWLDLLVRAGAICR